MANNLIRLRHPRGIHEYNEFSVPFSGKLDAAGKGKSTIPFNYHFWAIRARSAVRIDKVIKNKWQYPDTIGINQ